MTVTKDIRYIGVNDHDIELFEGQFVVPLGMAYNSYFIDDSMITIMDSVETRFKDEWLANIERELNGRKPTYLVVQHMEPDHSSNITSFMEKYPEAKIVSSDKAFKMMKNFYGDDYSDRQVVIKEGDKLSLGKHVLKFVAAPMVHWPEVMMTYDETDKVLFSADAFGKFGANDVVDPEGWACEARRYYFGIVGKFGAQVQLLFKKLSGLEIKAICSLHGPVLTDNIEYYLNIYNTWSSYGVESKGVVVFYTSVYGNTEKAAEVLAKKLESKGCPKVDLVNLVEEDIHESVEDAFRYGKIVLCSTTYNGGVFPRMKQFISMLTDRMYQKRTIAFMENGSWAPMATKTMKDMFASSKDITFVEHGVTIASAMTEENEKQMDALVDELLK